MSKATRILTMTGMALIAGATIGSAPAMAAPSATHTTAATTQSADRVGYFRTRMQCERAGRIGEFLNRWDDYTCYRVPFGPRRGWYVLDVDWNWGHGHGFPGGGHGHGFPGGGHGHGFPGR